MKMVVLKIVVPAFLGCVLLVSCCPWTGIAITTQKDSYEFEDYQRDIQRLFEEEDNTYKHKYHQQHSSVEPLSVDHRHRKSQYMTDEHTTPTKRHQHRRNGHKDSKKTANPVESFIASYFHQRHRHSGHRDAPTFETVAAAFDPKQCCPGSMCACGLEVSFYRCYALCPRGYFGIGNECYNVTARHQTYNRGNGYEFCSNGKSSASLGAAPQQIHLTFGESSSTQLVVQWATFDFPNTPRVTKVGAWVATYKFEKSELSQAIFVPAEVVYYRSKMNKKGAPYYYIVRVESLTPKKRYYYRVGASYPGASSDSSDLLVSEQGTFKMLTGPSHGNKSNNEKSSVSNIIFTADMGVQRSDDTTTAILQEVTNGWPDVWFHAGDYAYDLHSKGGLQGDIFFQRNQPIMMNLPLQGIPGNHEHKHLFSQYVQRYRMPNYNMSRNMWYSMDIGAAHYVFFSTEVYYYDQPSSIGGKEAAMRQKEWLIKDLANANKNRDKVPWIITISHRPFYCSNKDRPPIEFARVYLEKVFYDAGVDIMVTGHKHSYERTYPIYNNIVTGHSSHNAEGIIHLINGQAGCSEGTSPILTPSNFTACYHWRPWLNSYGKMRVHNATHLDWELVCSLTGDTLDWVTVSKDKPFPSRPGKRQ